MTETTRHHRLIAVLVALAACGVIYGLCEGAAWWTLQRLNPAASQRFPMVDVPTLQQRIRAFQRQPGWPRVLLLADSLGQCSVLDKHGVAQVELNTLPAVCRQVLEATFTGAQVNSFAEDGLLPTDMSFILGHTLPALQPDAILLEVNVRAFSQEYQQGPDIMSRPWLAALADPADMVNAPTEMVAIIRHERPAWSTRWLTNTIRRWNLLYGQHEALTFPLLGDTLTLFLRAQVNARQQAEKPVRQDSLDELLGEDLDMEQIELMNRVAPLYRDTCLQPHCLQAQYLQRCIRLATEAGIPAIVFLTPQNRQFLAGLLPPEQLDDLLNQVRALSGSWAGPGVWVLDLLDTSIKPELFYDHCHLNPEGNRQLARHLMPLMAGLLARPERLHQ
jgi:hypothetical protein